MDISGKDRISADIFRHILDRGPQTLYSTGTGTRISLGTIHRHFKDLEGTGRLKVYEQKTDGRKKKAYGPTFYGIVYFARIDRAIRQKLENYFLIWSQRSEFLEMLNGEGFDVKRIAVNPKASKTVFRRYVEYGISIEEQISLLRSNPGDISHEMFVFIGEILLTSDPKFVEQWRYLYRNLPGLRRAIDANIRNLVALQRQLRK